MYILKENEFCRSVGADCVCIIFGDPLYNNNKNYTNLTPEKKIKTIESIYIAIHEKKSIT